MGKEDSLPKYNTVIMGRKEAEKLLKYTRENHLSGCLSFPNTNNKNGQVWFHSLENIESIRQARRKQKGRKTT